MSTITTELTGRLHAAADFMESVGWTQGRLRDDKGAVCATGAVMYCRPQDGDEYLIREVLRHRGTAEYWNDKEGRTAAEVVGVLRTDITDADLEATFGPQWEALVALVRRAARLTEDESRVLNAAWGAARGTALKAALEAALKAGRDVAWAATGAATGAAARAAALDAARALVVRDLIGTGGFTQADYDTLTRPWREVIGPVHPHDAGAPTEGDQG